MLLRTTKGDGMKAQILFNGTPYGVVEQTTIQGCYDMAEVFISDVIANANIGFIRGFHAEHPFNKQTTGWQIVIDVCCFNFKDNF